MVRKLTAKIWWLALILTLPCYGQDVYKGFSPQLRSRGEDTTNAILIKNGGLGYAGFYAIRQSDSIRLHINDEGEPTLETDTSLHIKSYRMYWDHPKVDTGNFLLMYDGITNEIMVVDTSWSQGGGISSLTDDILDFDVDKYTPYSSQNAGAFDVSSTSPVSTNRLNYDGRLYSTQIRLTGEQDSVDGYGIYRYRLLEEDGDPIIRQQDKYYSYGMQVDGLGISVGYNAGYLNKGYVLTALGTEAGRENSGLQVSAFGPGAGRENSGNYVSVIGQGAGYKNSGALSNGFGTYAISSNTGLEVVGFGYYALKDNTGSYAIGIGSGGGRTNDGDYLIGIGVNSGYDNYGDTCLYMGNASGYNGIGAQSIGIGFLTGKYNNWDKITKVGIVTNEFNEDVSTRKTFTNSALNATYDTWYIPDHGFADSGNYVNLQFDTVGSSTRPTGYYDGLIYRFYVSDKDTLVRTLSNTGSGTFALIRDYEITNSTGLGYNAFPLQANQMMFGDTNVTQNVFHGTMVITPQSSAPGSPVEGELYYDIEDHKLYCWDGTTWQALW